MVSVLVGALASPERPPPEYTRYVAMGDSFTAAPYVPATDTAAGCLRSSRNYPQLVAASLRVTQVLDRSCSGAQIDDLPGRQVTRRGVTVPPQMAALTSETDLVTVGIGFNHGRVYGRIASRCRKLTTVCRLADERGLLQRLVEEVRPRLTATLLQVRERAPQARLLVVGYPRLLPPEGDCLRLPRMRPEDRDTFRDVNAALAQQQAASADDVGAEYVDFYELSRGHDICSRTPWVQGRLGDSQVAAAMHPLAAGQAALADLIVATLRQRP